jgi:four helix bundle protein
VYRAVWTWDKFNRWTIGTQLVRSSDSIAANIAEAMGRFHAPDQRRLLVYARGSLYETEHWIECSAARGLLDGAQYEDRLAEIARTLTGLVNQRCPC